MFSESSEVSSSCDEDSKDGVIGLTGEPGDQGCAEEIAMERGRGQSPILESWAIMSRLDLLKKRHDDHQQQQLPGCSSSTPGEESRAFYANRGAVSSEKIDEILNNIHGAFEEFETFTFPSSKSERPMNSSALEGQCNENETSYGGCLSHLAYKWQMFAEAVLLKSSQKEPTSMREEESSSSAEECSESPLPCEPIESEDDSGINDSESETEKLEAAENEFLDFIDERILLRTIREMTPRVKLLSPIPPDGDEDKDDDDGFYDVRF